MNPPILQAVDAAFWYVEGHPLFRNVNFGITMESRIALVGPNGVGKSTFLSLLDGELEAKNGMIMRSGKVRIARFSQHHIEVLNLQQSAFENMIAMFPRAEHASLRAHLGSMGISGDLALQPIYTLSGGQKSRVSFAMVTWQRPHVLLLDEPTNHLDLDTVEALIIALNDYKGGVLMVSHDEHLITATCDDIWMVGQNTVRRLDGDFQDYKRMVEAEFGLAKS